MRDSLYNPSFCSDSTNTDSYRFFVKLSFSVEFIWCCISVFSIILRFFPIAGDFDFEYSKKRNSVLVSIKP